MSLLPYDLSAAIAEHGWRAAWSAALKHLMDSGQFQENGAHDHRAATRALFEEKVTVVHKTEGPLTVTLPAALALDVVRHLGQPGYLGALSEITAAMEYAFGRHWEKNTHYTFPVDADAGTPVPGLGALWLVTWAHQPEEIFQPRRRNGRSYTRLDWPNTYFLTAANGDSFKNRTEAEIRLLEEAAQAYPWLRSNVDIGSALNSKVWRANLETNSRLNRALGLGLYHWRKHLDRHTHTKDREALDRFTLKAIQTGALVDHGDDKFSLWDFVQGAGPPLPPSVRLTRLVDAIAFYQSPSTTKKGTWLPLVDRLLEQGARLNVDDACHDERMRRMQERFPETFTQLRGHELDLLRQDALAASAASATDEPPKPKRQRVRS